MPQPPLQVAVAVADEDGLAARPLVLEQRQVGGGCRVRQMHSRPSLSQEWLGAAAVIGPSSARKFERADSCMVSAWRGARVSMPDGLLADTGG